MFDEMQCAVFEILLREINQSVFCLSSIPISLLPLRSRRRESDDIVHIILQTIDIRASCSFLRRRAMAKKFADGEMGAATPSLKLSKMNYQVWSMMMEVYLDSHDL